MWLEEISKRNYPWDYYALQENKEFRKKEIIEAFIKNNPGFLTEKTIYECSGLVSNRIIFQHPELGWNYFEIILSKEPDYFTLKIKEQLKGNTEYELLLNDDHITDKISKRFAYKNFDKYIFYFSRTFKGNVSMFGKFNLDFRFLIENGIITKEMVDKNLDKFNLDEICKYILIDDLNKLTEMTYLENKDFITEGNMYPNRYDNKKLRRLFKNVNKRSRRDLISFSELEKNLSRFFDIKEKITILPFQSFPLNFSSISKIATQEDLEKYYYFDIWDIYELRQNEKINQEYLFKHQDYLFSEYVSSRNRDISLDFFVEFVNKNWNFKYVQKNMNILLEYLLTVFGSKLGKINSHRNDITFSLVDRFRNLNWKFSKLSKYLQ